MRKKFIIILASIGLVIMGGIFLFQKNIQSQTPIKSQNTPTPTHVVTHPTATILKEQVDFTDEQSVTITIKNFEYVPNNIKIKKGTKVTWINEDDMEHNAMLDHEDSEIPHEVHENHDPDKFESPILATGDSYTFTFNTVSLNPYHCSPHPWMKGRVEVVE